MRTFAFIATLFVVGSLIGWVIEVFFRRFFSAKKWINPGFLTGPYLPIYGFGVIGLFILSEVFINLDKSAFAAIPDWLMIVMQIVFIGVVLIAIEFVGGLIFIKGLGLKLWDYSDQKGNVMGIVCPLFDLLWTIAGAIYYFFIHPQLKVGVYWLAAESNNVYYLIIGVVLGMMIVDFCYSVHLATVVSRFAKEHRITDRFFEVKALVKKSGETVRARLDKVIKQIKDEDETPSQGEVCKTTDK